MRFSEQVALVTGAAGGIGQTLMAALQAKGATVEGLGNNPRHPAYGASKAGLHDLMYAAAVDHGPEGVRCNAAAPGRIDTPLDEDFIDSRPDPTTFRAQINGTHPLRRTGAPENVAELIVWRVRAHARFATGQVWTINGGRMSQLSLP